MDIVWVEGERWDRRHATHFHRSWWEAMQRLDLWTRWEDGFPEGQGHLSGLGEHEGAILANRSAVWGANAGSLQRGSRCRSSRQISSSIINSYWPWILYTKNNWNKINKSIKTKTLYVYLSPFSSLCFFSFSRVLVYLSFSLARIFLVIYSHK